MFTKGKRNKAKKQSEVVSKNRPTALVDDLL